MEQKMVDVMIHIDPETTHTDRENLRDLLLKHNGVDSASYHDDKPHLMLAVYDPDTVNSEELLNVVKDQGINCELVGL